MDLFGSLSPLRLCGFWKAGITSGTKNGWKKKKKNDDNWKKGGGSGRAISNLRVKKHRDRRTRKTNDDALYNERERTITKSKRDKDEKGNAHIAFDLIDKHETLAVKKCNKRIKETGHDEEEK